MSVNRLQYELSQKLGSGSFGEVYLAINKRTSCKVAIKMVPDTSKTAISEVELLKDIDNQYIIKYIGSYFDTCKLHIVMEYADVGTLTSYLAKPNINLQEWQIWRFTSHMSSALEYLHGRHILHRDLKPDNILGVTVWCPIEKGDRVAWKLADFGIAKLLDRYAAGRYYAASMGGTIIYMSPEVLRNCVTAPELYSSPADMWSLGTVISEFCNNGKGLFKSEQDVYNWPGGRSSLPGHYSIGLKQMVADLLNPNPKSRPTAQKVRQETKLNDRQETGKH